MLKHMPSLCDALNTRCVHSVNTKRMVRLRSPSAFARGTVLAMAFGKFARSAVLLALFLLAAPQVNAQGGPPMLTDDPDTPGNKHWEINAAFTGTDMQSEKSRAFPHVDFNYGLGESIQLKYEVGWLFNEQKGQSWQSGLGNSLIGIKWRFIGAEDADFKVSTYPQYEFENATNSVERGVAEPGPNLLLPIEVSRSFGRVTVVGEVGYQYLHNERDEQVYGLLGALQASDNLELLVEIHGTVVSGTNVDPLINIGLRRALGNRLKLLASIGTGLTNDPDSTDLIAYLGVQFLLGQQ